ncbi:glucosyltransferase [Dispira simplex]|nr:glucosyltransferase [Dispira simplex]
MGKLITAIGTLCFALVTGALVYVVNRYVPEPYMDEKFHVAQAQAYCQGRYSEWHPKLTTPPGLYVVSNLLLYLVGWFTALNSAEQRCSLEMLRYTNWVQLVALYVVTQSILSQRRPGLSRSRLAIEAIVVCLFPVLYFSGLLYYTDVGSTLFIALGYAWAQSRYHWLAALSCLVAVTYRQTNAIWTCLILVAALLREFQYAPASTALRRQVCFTRAIQLNVFYEGLQHAWVAGRAFWQYSRFLWPAVLPYLIVEVMFGLFLVWNRGIVLGDHEHHLASLHFPQIYYCVAFLTGILAPTIFRLNYPVSFLIYTTKYLRSMRFIILSVLLIACTLFSIHRFTLEHPFILSDNRHYSFYVWKDIYRTHPLVRYLLVPFYFFGFWLLSRVLAYQQTLVWCLAYLGCVVLTLVPSPLLEFRYFVLPYYFLRTHIAVPKQHRLGYELVCVAKQDA